MATDWYERHDEGAMSGAAVRARWALWREIHQIARERGISPDAALDIISERSLPPPPIGDGVLNKEWNDGRDEEYTGAS